MDKEMAALIKSRKADAASLIKYANPRSRTRPDDSEIIEILLNNIPYRGKKPSLKLWEAVSYSKNEIIKSAKFKTITSDGKTFELKAYQSLIGQTPEEKEADSAADYPSGLFNIFHKEIKI